MKPIKHPRLPMPRMLPALIAGLVCTAAAWTPAWSQTATTTTTTTTTEARKLDRADESFLKDAAESNMAEIEAAKTAAGKATHPDVKAFAQMLIDDHTKATSELAALAATKNVKLPTDPTMVDKAKQKVLNMRDADSFDKHFVKSLGVNAHEDTIKRFEKVIRDGKDPDVKAFATRTLPTLQQHLQHAKELQAQLDKQGKR